MSTATSRRPEDALCLLRDAHKQLAAYLAEHDHGDWIDPNAVADAVADIHDATRMLLVILQIGGVPSPAEI